MMISLIRASAVLLVWAAAARPGMAQNPESCATMRYSDPGWTDITVTNGVAAALLEAPGDSPDIAILSVPVGYEALKNGDTDVFLGNWMPARQLFRDALDPTGQIENWPRTLKG